MGRWSGGCWNGDGGMTVLSVGIDGQIHWHRINGHHIHRSRLTSKYSGMTRLASTEETMSDRFPHSK